MQRDAETLQHTKWQCKYHVVIIPKCRKRKLYGEIKKEVGASIRELAEQKESKIEEGRLCADHVHMMISIPPKYSVAQVVGYIKGKSAIFVARYFGRRRNFVGEHFWAKGYYVSTAGRDEQAVREYIRRQEENDKRIDQLNLFR